MSRGTLDYLDKISRAAVRGWLRLPRDTPIPFFHADARDGGLAVPIMRYVIPILRRKRMSRMFTSEDSVVRSVTELPVYQRDIKRWSAPLSAFGQAIRNGETIRKAMAYGLYRTVDGLGLRGCSDSGFVNQWVTDGSAFLTGHSYANCVRLKGGLVHTALRSSRGRPDASTHCDACNATESIGHILQVCPRTHHVRIARHDSVNTYLAKSMRKNGFSTHVEPAIPTPAGLRYPDLIAYKGNTCVVIDTTIIGDTFDLDAAHGRKVAYYDVNAIRSWCSRETGVLPPNVQFSACVLNWRGTPSIRSTRELGDFGVTKRDWHTLSVKVLEGGVKSISAFKRSTGTWGGVRQ